MRFEIDLMNLNFKRLMNELSYKEQLEREVEERDKKFRKIDEVCSKLEEEANKYDYWYNCTGDPIWESRMNSALSLMEELEDYRRYLEEEVYIDDGIDLDDLEGGREYLMEEDSDDSVEIVDVGPFKKN